MIDSFLIKYNSRGFIPDEDVYGLLGLPGVDHNRTFQELYEFKLELIR